MAGYQPERGRGRERPDRYRGQRSGAYAGEERTRAGRSPQAGPRRSTGRHTGYGESGHRAGGGYGPDNGYDTGYGYGDGGGYPGGDRYGDEAGYGGERRGSERRGSERYGGERYGGERRGGGYGAPARYREQDRPRRRDTTGGAEGNERLTGLTGATLLVLLAAEGFTLLRIHQLLTLHFFIGMLLVGPVLLKAGSTIYRFIRYYTGAPEYRRKGPPAPLLRLLGPFVLLLSVTVIGTGIMLAVAGPGQGMWLFLHKASFVLWFCAMAVHVLAYVWRLPHLVGADLATRAGSRAREVLAGRPARWLMLTASILAGLLLAVSTVHLAGAWNGVAFGG